MNPLISFFDRPDIRKRYFTVMSELIETTFSDREFKKLLDTHLSGWAPRSTIERLEDYMALRSAYAKQVIRRAIGTSASQPSPTSATSWKSPMSQVVIK